MTAESTIGEYFFIPYQALTLLSLHDAEMGEILAHSKQFIRENGGIPWCDFKVYRKEVKIYQSFIYMPVQKYQENVSL